MINTSALGRMIVAFAAFGAALVALWWARSQTPAPAPRIVSKAEPEFIQSGVEKLRQSTPPPLEVWAPALVAGKAPSLQHFSAAALDSRIVVGFQPFFGARIVIGRASDCAGGGAIAFDRAGLLRMLGLESAPANLTLRAGALEANVPSERRQIVVGESTWDIAKAEAPDACHMTIAGKVRVGTLIQFDILLTYSVSDRTLAAVEFRNVKIDRQFEVEWQGIVLRGDVGSATAAFSGSLRVEGQAVQTRQDPSVLAPAANEALAGLPIKWIDVSARLARRQFMMTIEVPVLGPPAGARSDERAMGPRSEE